MLSGFIFLITSLGLSLIPVAGIFTKSSTTGTCQGNSAPVVKIISPADGSSVAPGTQVHYAITVSDREDGESKYDEINAKEVLLRVAYVRDTLQITIQESREKEPAGLTAMRTSNCFDCHAFDSRSIGPAFTDIRERYQPTPANMASLERRIREGSTGIWGDATMPTHRELSDAQIRNIVEWIMTGDDAHYYVGTKGSFAVPEEMVGGALILTASYTDHGNSKGDMRLRGQNAVVVRIR